jgi:hypothetical protein
MRREEGVTLRVEDIGHLHGRPAHACSGFRSRRDRGTPVAASRAAAQGEWAPRGDAVATGGDTPSCATGRRGRAAAESCADRCPLPADGSHTSGVYSASGIVDTMPSAGLCRMTPFPP